MDKQMRINKEQLSLIKNSFKDENDVLLKELRKYFFGVGEFPKEINESLKSVLKILVFPEIDLNTPIGQQVDLFLTLNIDNVDEDERVRLIEIRFKLIDFLKNKFGMGGVEFNINDIPTNSIDLRARNLYILHIEQQLVQIKTLANLPEEKETANNSNK